MSPPTSPGGERLSKLGQDAALARQLDRRAPLGRPVIKEDAELHRRDDEQCPGTKPAPAPGEHRRQRATTRRGRTREIRRALGRRAAEGAPRADSSRARPRPTASTAKTIAEETPSAKPGPARSSDRSLRRQERPDRNCTTTCTGPAPGRYPNRGRPNQAEITFRPPAHHRGECETDRDDDFPRQGRPASRPCEDRQEHENQRNRPDVECDFVCLGLMDEPVRVVGAEPQVPDELRQDQIEPVHRGERVVEQLARLHAWCGRPDRRIASSGRAGRPPGQYPRPWLQRARAPVSTSRDRRPTATAR